MKLTIKLTLSYIFISIFLIISLLLISNYALEKEFQKYKQVHLEKQNLEIVSTISNEYINKKKPNMMFFTMLGSDILDLGIVLTILDVEGKEVFSMRNVNHEACQHMIGRMKSNMKNRYAKFDGSYTEKKYDIINGDYTYGYVVLGYYGPYYYQDEDIAFINVLNKVFLITGLVFLILATAFGIFMASKISEPIKKIIEKTKLIGNGDFKSRINLHSKTKEISELIYSVNSLANNLESQQNTKKQMARDYAHEFRTPLATLQSNFEAMIDDVFEPTKERLESCNEEVLRLSRMVSNLDKIFEIENSSSIIIKETFDLNKLIENILLNFENEFIIKEIKITTDLKSGFLYADKDKIKQVILNLLSNSIKFTEKNAEIKISTKDYFDKVLITVKDNGIGISKDDLEKIFEHLYRSDKSRTRSLCFDCKMSTTSLSCSMCKVSGSGIGLSVVKAIVESHGGRIYVKSELGVFSEFFIYL